MEGLGGNKCFWALSCQLKSINNFIDVAHLRWIRRSLKSSNIPVLWESDCFKAGVVILLSV